MGGRQGGGGVVKYGGFNPSANYAGCYWLNDFTAIHNINPFSINVPLLYPVKTSKDRGKT